MRQIIRNSPPLGHRGGEFRFRNGDFVLCRFSGTEPLLRVCAESSTAEKARSYVDAFRAFLGV